MKIERLDDIQSNNDRHADFLTAFCWADKGYKRIPGYVEFRHFIEKAVLPGENKRYSRKQLHGYILDFLSQGAY